MEKLWAQTQHILTEHVPVYQAFSAVRYRNSGNHTQHRKSTFLPRYKRGVGCPEGSDLNLAQLWR